ncbi:MAG: PQQ-dependent sugar dehydrogenase [Halobacteriales archaeon]|nr:PQQ-dependent sugar dehydrogenase [Halobacteriales archaeon]
MDRRSTRRRFLKTAAVGSLGFVSLAGCTQSESPSGSDRSTPTTTTAATGGTSTPGSSTEDGTPPLPSVRLESLTTGLDAPLDFAAHPDRDQRYIADQTGRIFLHDDTGRRDRPALDLRDTLEFGGEKGLLGIALHPKFAENRRVFVRYSAPRRSGTPSDYSHTFVLAEFTANADGTIIKRDSERTILEIPEPQSNHNAGDLAFGPDGYLYIAVGDGGAGGDQGTGHVDDWYDGVGGGNGQDVTENLLGSILRIDVDTRSGDRPYGIPRNNPLVDTDGLDEHYAWGLRNPWRMSFDRETDELYVGDVGQNRFEEVNIVEKGGNYGWNVKEGTHCYRTNSCPSAAPSGVRGGEQLQDPIIEYPHSGRPVSGSSVIGGYVYRGSTLPALTGRYVFGDLSADGRLFVASRSTSGLWPTEVLELSDEEPTVRQLLSFGQDDAGELYVLGRGSQGGGVYKLAPTE